MVFISRILRLPGPSEITIFDADAVPIILGTGSKCIKSPWYDANHPDLSLHTYRDKAAHDQRRKIWDKGFGAKGIQDFPRKFSIFMTLTNQ